MKATQAYVRREFRRFLKRIGFAEGSPDDREKVVALLLEMQKTAREGGMSEYRMATTYDADALMEVYCETLRRRH